MGLRRCGGNTYSGRGERTGEEGRKRSSHSIAENVRMYTDGNHAAASGCELSLHRSGARGRGVRGGQDWRSFPPPKDRARVGNERSTMSRRGVLSSRRANIENAGAGAGHRAMARLHMVMACRGLERRRARARGSVQGGDNCLLAVAPRGRAPRRAAEGHAAALRQRVWHPINRDLRLRSRRPLTRGCGHGQWEMRWSGSGGGRRFDKEGTIARVGETRMRGGAFRQCHSAWRGHERSRVLALCEGVPELGDDAAPHDGEAKPAAQRVRLQGAEGDDQV